MKRKTFILMLCVCLLFCTLSGPFAQAGSDVCFIAVNDDHLIDLSYMPYFSGGVTYVPYWVFTDYDFSIYYSYFSETSTAMLYNSNRQIFFDMKNGTTYDDRDNTYTTAKAVMRNGTVYVPATFICNFFGGMACSYISGGDYGDIVRIKDASFVLSDIDFLRAASELMQKRYESYIASTAIQSEPLPQTTEEPLPDKEGTKAYLSFTGLPSDTVLAALKRYNAGACFFLTAGDVESAPDLVRSLDCEGYMLGVLCSDDAMSDYETVSSLIYETAHVKTLLVTAMDGSSEACAQAAAESGLVYWSYDIDGMSTDTVTILEASITNVLDSRTRDSSLFLSCDGNTDSYIASLLRHMSEEHLDICAPRETDVWGSFR